MASSQPLDSPPGWADRRIGTGGRPACVLRRGYRTGVVESLPRSARTAGLEVAATEGFFVLGDPDLAFEIHASTLQAFKDAAVSLGVAAGDIDALIATLRAGKTGCYEWVSTPFFIDLTLRKPAIA